MRANSPFESDKKGIGKQSNVPLFDLGYVATALIETVMS